jgi:hypothetical protein
VEGQSVFWNHVLGVVLLTVLYAAVIVGLVWWLRRIGVPGRWAIFSGFLAFGIGTGLLAAWTWPYDSCLYPNVWAVLAGDELYDLSTDLIGDVWVLQLPRVYVLVAATVYGGAGLLVQWVYNRTQARQVSRPNR